MWRWQRVRAVSCPLTDIIWDWLQTFYKQQESWEWKSVWTPPPLLHIYGQTSVRSERFYWNQHNDDNNNNNHRGSTVKLWGDLELNKAAWKARLFGDGEDSEATTAESTKTTIYFKIRKKHLQRTPKTDLVNLLDTHMWFYCILSTTNMDTHTHTRYYWLLLLLTLILTPNYI